MTRVSENSNKSSVEFSLNSLRKKLEDLQLKGSNLKRIVKPSDDPVANIKVTQYKTENVDVEQYQRNVNYAVTNLEFIENSITELTDILVKAKEVAIQQSSDLYNADIRKSISEEIKQLFYQALGVGNRRLGNRYIFSGYRTLQRPFDNEGKYHGDSGVIQLEIFKDFFVPTNVPGNEVFNIQRNLSEKTKVNENADQMIDNIDNNEKTIFDILKLLNMSLETNNVKIVQELLPSIDQAIDQLITLRTRIGSNFNTVQSTVQILDNKKIFNAKNQSQLEDADFAELVSDLNKQNTALDAAYKASNKILEKRLLDFIR